MNNNPVTRTFDQGLRRYVYDQAMKTGIPPTIRGDSGSPLDDAGAGAGLLPPPCRGRICSSCSGTRAKF